MSNTKTTDKIILIHEDGNRWVFNDIYDAAIKLIDWKLIYHWGSDSHIGDHFGLIYDTGINCFGKPIGRVSYILRSEFGDVITKDDISEAFAKIRTDSRNARIDKEIARAQRNFRCAPEPSTGYRRYGNCYRHISTYSEHRDNDALNYDDDAIEYNIKSRSKRTKSYLPNYWDDRIRSDYDVKNWKRQRKTQWKQKD